MTAWKDGGMEGWMDGWMDAWMDARMLWHSGMSKHQVNYQHNAVFILWSKTIMCA
jgi:hypothetical protein